MKKYFFLLFFVIGILDLYAQQSIINEIDSKFSLHADSVQRMARLKLKSQVIGQQEKVISDSAKKSIEVDSLKIVLQTQQNEIVQEKDTLLFKQRMAEVKKPEVQKSLQSEVEWSKEVRISNYLGYNKVHMLDTAYRVFGWHPYWCGDAYKSYNFSLLSFVSYFSYEVDPKSGFYIDIHNWRETNIVDSAHKYDSKVLLTLSLFGCDNVRTFLTSVASRKNLIATSITLVREKGADGLTLDFENIPRDQTNAFVNFLIDLATSMRRENPDYMLTVAIPPVDFEKIFAFKEINNYVDYYVMMGYEYHGSNSKLAGPVAPLENGSKWIGFSLSNSVDEYLANGVPPRKLLLGVPYYGTEWITDDLKFPSPAKKFVQYHSYRQVKQVVGKSMGEIDLESTSKYHAYSDRLYNYRQIWFEDSITLAAKYDWVKSKKIGGIGIWALGYDNGYDELWKLIASKFAYSEKEVKKFNRTSWRASFRRIVPFVKRFVKNPMSVIKHPKAFLRVLGAFAGLSLVGLFVVFRYGRRFKRLFRLALKGGISAIVLFTIAIVLVFFKYFELRELLFLIGGFIIGGVLFLVLSRRYITEKDLP